jgi:hypothetical protein
MTSVPSVAIMSLGIVFAFDNIVAFLFSWLPCWRQSLWYGVKNAFGILMHSINSGLLLSSFAKVQITDCLGGNRGSKNVADVNTEAHTRNTIIQVKTLRTWAGLSKESVASGYGMDDRSSIPGIDWNVFIRHHVQTYTQTQRGVYVVGDGCYYPEEKTAEAWISRQTSLPCRIKECMARCFIKLRDKFTFAGHLPELLRQVPCR